MAINDWRAQRPTAFLSLAPATSVCYPTTQAAQKPAAPRAGHSRSSTQSSIASIPDATNATKDDVKSSRFLKLGPVYWGEHPEEDQDDFRDATKTQPSASAPMMNFLSLAPQTSDCYPKSAQDVDMRRRSSTVSSVGSRDEIRSPRFLKLGPVAFGEHLEECQNDFRVVPAY